MSKSSNKVLYFVFLFYTFLFTGIAIFRATNLHGWIFYISVIVLGGFIVSPIFFIKHYNTIIKRKNQIDNAFGSIQANLTRRHDLIPNLVSSVKEYMEYESDILDEVVELRDAAESEDLSSEEKEQVESNLTSALDTLMVQVEDYPDLLASRHFVHLQHALNEIEEEISAHRRLFNSAVKNYNDSIEIFPGNIIASVLNFESRKVFEAEVHEHKVPDIQGSFNE